MNKSINETKATGISVSEKEETKEEIIQLKKVKKVYSGRESDIIAVNNVSFDIRRGEIFSLLGPNGAGKTTTFRMISTLESPTSGEIYVDGSNTVKEPSKIRNKIGLIPQGDTLYDKLTPVETLDLMGSLYDVPPKTLKQRTKELLELVGLEDRKNDLVEGFSGGMKQRLSLASGLIHRPKILLLDEPTTGLDPQTRRKLWDLIRELNDEGITIFINTHIMEEADSLSDRVAIMKDGKLAAIGSSKELKKKAGEGEVIEAEIIGKTNKAIKTLKNHSLINKIKSNGQKIIIWSEDRNKLLTKLPKLLDQEKISLKSLEVKQPSLEDAFIQLTG